MKPALAAVAVAAIASAVAGLTRTHDSHDSGVATQGPSPSPSTSTTPIRESPSSNPAPPLTPTTGASTTASTATQCLTARQALAQFVAASVIVDTVHGYLCDNGWIYVNYHYVSTGNHATILLHDPHGQWTIANKSIDCPSDPAASPMPAAIYEYGCGN
jgi:hypothetical protein